MPEESNDFQERESSEGIYCEHCNRLLLRPELNVEIEGHYYCSNTCALNDDWYLCEQCNNWIRSEDAISINGFIYCSEECISDAGYSDCYCDRCDRRILSDDLIMTEDDNCFCSSHCASHFGYSQCDICNNWVSTEHHYITAYGSEICGDCRDSHDYDRCDRCHHLYQEGDLTYVEEDDEYLCPSCYDNHNTVVHPYGYTPILTFFGESITHPYLGVELEIDQGQKYNCASEVDEKFNGWIYMTNDGSLSDSGIELTSHPMTTEVHLDGRWKKLFKLVKGYGYTSHDNGDCGLHVHINRDFFGSHRTFQYLAGQKLATMFDRFQVQLRKFSRRDNDRWCEYSYDLSYLVKYNNRNMLDKAAAIIDSHSGHSRAVNFEHSKTFEIRIFRGTLKIETFYASLILVDAFARAVKNHSTTWCETVSWYEFIEWAISTCDLEEGKRAFAEYLYTKGLIEDTVYYHSKVKQIAL